MFFLHSEKKKQRETPLTVQGVFLFFPILQDGPSLVNILFLKKAGMLRLKNQSMMQGGPGGSSDVPTDQGNRETNAGWISIL